MLIQYLATYIQKALQYWYLVVQEMMGKLYVLSLFYIMCEIICTLVATLFLTLSPVMTIPSQTNSPQRLFQRLRCQSMRTIHIRSTHESAAKPYAVKVPQLACLQCLRTQRCSLHNLRFHLPLVPMAPSIVTCTLLYRKPEPGPPSQRIQLFVPFPS